MALKYQVDEVDQEILAYLVENARMPFLEIARACGISGAAVHQRVKKLEEAGIIEGSRVNVRPKALGYGVCSFVGIQFSAANEYEGVVNSLQQIREVVECHFTTGQFALLCKIYCRDNEHLMEVLVNTIQNIPGVLNTETYISLDQAFERQVCVENPMLKQIEKE